MPGRSVRSPRCVELALLARGLLVDEELLEPSAAPPVPALVVLVVLVLERCLALERASALPGMKRQPPAAATEAAVLAKSRSLECDKGQPFLFLNAYGVSCRARAERAALRRNFDDSPQEPW